MSESIELLQIIYLDHLNHVLSLEFKEKWRYRFSSHFVSVFQEKLLNALVKQKRIKLSSLVSTYTKKYKYDISTVLEFFRCIEIEDLYPVIYEDEKFSRKIKP